jgi:hypothetical protein
MPGDTVETKELCQESQCSGDDSDGQIRENESGGRCSKCEGEENMYKIVVAKPEQQSPLGEFFWFSTATSSGPLRISKCSIKYGQFIVHSAPLYEVS